MAGPLNLQAKLALAHTSMTQRQMAAVMGVSPRTVGRWLREGTPEGVARIPPEAAGIVGVVWDIHRTLAKDAARKYEIPYNAEFPVLAIRKPLQFIDPKTGRKRPKIDKETGLPILGDRIFIENAQFIDGRIRRLIVVDAALTEKVITATVGTRLNLSRYYQSTTEQRIAEHKKSKKRDKATIRELRQKIDRSFREAFGVAPGSLELQNEIRLVYTPRAFISIDSTGRYGMVGDLGASIEAMESVIKQKHAPATGEPGTGVGEQIIFQMRREHTIEANERIARRETAKTRRRRK